MNQKIFELNGESESETKLIESTVHWPAKWMQRLQSKKKQFLRKPQLRDISIEVIFILYPFMATMLNECKFQL